MKHKIVNWAAVERLYENYTKPNRYFQYRDDFTCAPNKQFAYEVFKKYYPICKKEEVKRFEMRKSKNKK